MSDETVVAQTIYGEARSLGYRGMHSVSNVIMNRVAKKTWWGLNPSEVCLKPYQFSCWLKDDPNLPKLKTVTISDPQYVMALQLATDACQDCLPDITNGAVSYYSDYITPPEWSAGHTPCFKVGNMLFFNDIT